MWGIRWFILVLIIIYFGGWSYSSTTATKLLCLKIILLFVRKDLIDLSTDYNNCKSMNLKYFISMVFLSNVFLLSDSDDPIFSAFLPAMMKHLDLSLFRHNFEMGRSHYYLSHQWYLSAMRWHWHAETPQ